jgi:hypothetical protein
MKVNVSNFLKELAEKAGVDANDPALVDILSHTELNRIELPNEITTAINRSLLSVTDAKNNHPAIKTHYFAEVMSNVDRSLENAYRELELEPDTIEELNAERSSTKRIALLGTKLKDAIGKKVEAAGKKPSETVASLNQQIDALNNQLRIEKEARTAEANKAKQEMNRFRTNLILTGKTGSVKTIYDNLPSDVRLTTIDTLLGKELQDNNAHFLLDDDGNLKLQKKDGSNYYDENNRQVTVDDFINRTLAKHKVLKQSDGTPPEETPTGGEYAANNGTNNGQPTHVGGQSPKRINVSSLISESLNGLDGKSDVNML